MTNCIERDIFVLRDASCVAQPIEYVQGTNAIPILLHVRDYEIPEGSTARVYIEWPSTKGEYDTADIEGNSIRIKVKDTMFSEVGKCSLRLVIINGEDTLVTFSYPVVVKKNNVPGIVNPSQNQSDFLDEYLEEITERLDASKQAYDDAEQMKLEVDEVAAKVESMAETVEKNMKSSETNAILAQSYAIGGTGTRENEEVANAKFYYEQAERIAKGLSGALLPCETITFEELADVQALPGYMYNISNDFVTDDRFIHSGISHGIGANIYMTIDGLWDVLASSNVVSINGKTGVVILKAADIECGDGETVQSKLDKVGILENLTTGAKDTIVNAINWLNNLLTSLSNSLVSLTQRVGTNETAIGTINTDLANTNKTVDELNTNISNITQRFNGSIFNVDIDTIRETMFVYCFVSNTPTGFNGYLLHIQSDSNIALQYFIPYDSGGPENIYFRQLLDNETWTNWTTSIEQYLIYANNAYYPYGNRDAFIGIKKTAIVTFMNDDNSVLHTSHLTYDSHDPYVIWNSNGLRLLAMYNGATKVKLTWI